MAYNKQISIIENDQFTPNSQISHQFTQQEQFQQDKNNNKFSNFSDEIIHNMDNFDVKKVYSDKQIQNKNKYRSDFIFAFQVNCFRNANIVAIERKQIIWTIIKEIILVIIVLVINSWLSKLSSISTFIKSSLETCLIILPIVFPLVMIINPGYILDHQIQQHEYIPSKDKKRPKNGKYCQHCRLFIKKSSGHCFRCNHCVKNFDHHCSVMARCVGKANQILFYTFVLLINAVYMATILVLFYSWVFV